MLSFVSCSNNSPEVKTIEISEKSIFLTSANLTKLNISINGMSCEMGCALKIEKKLNAKYGANTIKVDFLKKSAIFHKSTHPTTFLYGLHCDGSSQR